MKMCALFYTILKLFLSLEPTESMMMTQGELLTIRFASDRK